MRKLLSQRLEMLQEVEFHALDMGGNVVVDEVFRASIGRGSGQGIPAKSRPVVTRFQGHAALFRQESPNGDAIS